MNINLTLIGQTIVFAIFVWFCMKFIWPPIVTAMAERKKKIADGLLAAERSLFAQQEAEEKADITIKQSKAQAADIIANANKQASETIEDAKSIATVEADKVKQKAQSELEQEVLKATKELKDKVADLVMLGVSKVLEKEVDSKTHQEMLKKISTTL
ncbi:ATP synthase F0 sector subunit b [hydrothermal vent metagenome]|uniref:ATP synthase F0 sector subunit b n=1 Tax=hydrothermal vent metagenome TaxID=652676 RepID=A0A1W1CW31_9ZZZZ